MASCCLLLLLLAVQVLLDTVLVGGQNTNFRFPSFNTTDSFLMIEDIQHDLQTSSFTMTPKGAALFTESCGKLFYKEQVRMKDAASGAVASFHTAFTFLIYGPNIYKTDLGLLHADGFTFTLCTNSSLYEFVNNRGYGDLFCLLSYENNGMASSRVFAVEFDTFRDLQVNDPSDSHIGVNINSVNSTWYHNLCGGSLINCSYLCNGGYFTAWIDYDSASQSLEVFFANGSLASDIPKPPNPVINASLASAVPFSDLVDDYMYVGFTASTGRWGELHQIQSWAFSSSGMPHLENGSQGSVHGRKVAPQVIIPGVISAGAVAGLLLLVSFFVARARRRTIIISDMEGPDGHSTRRSQSSPVARAFTCKELRKATKNFSKSELVGSGGSGKVYKGTLPSGALVAVKRIKHWSEHLEKCFKAEIDSLKEIAPHPNLVQLRGWCHEEEQLFVVYDYMVNGSMDEWLFGCPKRHRQRSSNVNKYASLPLHVRCSILRGLAAGLLYLHEECAQCVLHRDIKSSNVLLDGFWTAHLGDFGLARVVTHWKMGEKTTPEAGTFGYMAPELPHIGKATKESDVYSFGVLMLEVMCGARPLEGSAGDGTTLLDRVWTAHEAGNILQVADSRLGTFPPSHATRSDGEYELQSEVSCIDSSIHVEAAAMEGKNLITNLLRLGLLCCDPNPKERPSMRLVSQWLQSPDNMEIYLPTLRPHAHYAEGAHNRIY